MEQWFWPSRTVRRAALVIAAGALCLACEGSDGPANYAAPARGGKYGATVIAGKTQHILLTYRSDPAVQLQELLAGSDKGIVPFNAAGMKGETWYMAAIPVALMPTSAATSATFYLHSTPGITVKTRGEYGVFADALGDHQGRYVGTLTFKSGTPELSGALKVIGAQQLPAGTGVRRASGGGTTEEWGLAFSLDYKGNYDVGSAIGSEPIYMNLGLAVGGLFLVAAPEPPQ